MGPVKLLGQYVTYSWDRMGSSPGTTWRSIVHTFEICRESHVAKKLKNACAEIKAVMNLKLSVFLVRTT